MKTQSKFKRLLSILMRSLLPLAALVALSLPAAPVAHAGPRYPPDDPGPRTGHTLVSIGGNLYLFGGWLHLPDLTLAPQATVIEDDLWEFEIEDSPLDWIETTTPDPKPSARADHSAAAGQGEMYVFGGRDGDLSVLNEFWGYNPETNTWEPVTAANPPPGRSAHASTGLADGRVVVVGGWDGNWQELRDIWFYDPAANQWSRGSDCPFNNAILYDIALAASGDSVYVIGPFEGQPGQRVLRYDTAAEAWSDVTPGGGLRAAQGEAPTARLNAAYAQVGDTLWLFGGEDNETGEVLKDVWGLDLNTLTWVRGDDLPESRTRARAAALDDGRVLVYGGLGEGRTPLQGDLLLSPGGGTEADDDGDGVSNAVEDGAANGGDGNDDGTPDRQQANVVSLPNAVDGRYVTLEIAAGKQFTQVEAVGNPSPGDAPPLKFPYGFFGFAITGLTPGETVEVTLYLPAPLPATAEYWKYGPTVGEPADHWYQVAMGDNDGDAVVTIALTDGGLGDDDLAAEGTIVDQGGPGVPGGAPVGGFTEPVVAAPGPVVAVLVAAVAVLGLLALSVRHRL